MGADLIGYLLKGPATITKTPEEREAFFHGLTKLPGTELVALDQDGDLEPDDPYEDVPEDERAEWLEEWAFDLPAFLEACDAFETWWNGGCEARDACSRQDPDDPDQCLVFAGEMSWGDTPGGAGYEALQAAIRHHLFEFYGIR